MALLSRPDGKLIKITPKHGTVFMRPELYLFVGVHFELLKLLSGDYMLVQKDYQNDSGIRNGFASMLCKKDVHGTTLLVEPAEID